MFRSWKLGKAFGIPLFVHPTFLLLVPWVLFQSRGQGMFSVAFALAVLVAIFTCVMLHELGHALVARWFGIGTRDITLYPIGGVARLDRMSERPHEELCIALAGPAVNVAIAALLTPVLFLAVAAGAPVTEPDAVLFARGLPAVLAAYAFWVWAGNVVLVAFNLIPAFPMDGGRVLRAVLSGWLGHVRATDIAGRVGLVMAALLAFLAVFVLHNPVLALISIFVAFVGQQERLAVRYREARRRAAACVAPAEVMAAPRGFSGVAWDGTYRVWVRWVDGRPVGYYAPAE